jgi:molecular chaperone DnaK
MRSYLITQVYATDGDDDLGGSDFDMCLFDGLTSTLESKVTHRTQDVVNDLASSRSDHELEEYINSTLGTSFSELCTSATIRQKSEDIKKLLTWHSSSLFSCDALSIGEHKTPLLQKVQFSVTREYFELTCSYLFERSLVPVTRLLADLAMQKEDIDEIVLVGGSTRIPLVKQQLK